MQPDVTGRVGFQVVFIQNIDRSRCFYNLGLILVLNQLIHRINSLPFSTARLSAAEIKRKLHCHPLLISISPGLAAA